MSSGRIKAYQNHSTRLERWHKMQRCVRMILLAYEKLQQSEARDIPGDGDCRVTCRSMNVVARHTVSIEEVERASASGNTRPSGGAGS